MVNIPLDQSAVKHNTDEFPKASGIYMIYCASNNKVYIGSATDLRRRKKAHINHLKAKRHGNLKLQRSWDKYRHR